MATRASTLEEEVGRLLDTGKVSAAATQAIKGYGPEILGYLAAVLKSESAADDAFGIFCEEFWRSLAAFERRCSVRTWAYRLAWNCARRLVQDPHLHRGRRLTTAETSALAAEVRSTTQSHLKESARTWLQQVRESLSVEERTLLVLRIDRGLAWREVATAMSGGGEEIEEAALRKRFDRLKRKLQEAARSRGTSK